MTMNEPPCWYCDADNVPGELAKCEQQCHECAAMQAAATVYEELHPEVEPIG